MLKSRCRLTNRVELRRPMARNLSTMLVHVSFNRCWGAAPAPEEPPLRQRDSPWRTYISARGARASHVRYGRRSKRSPRGQYLGIYKSINRL